MAQPHTYENSLRVHDKAVYDWVGTLPVDYGAVNGNDRNQFPILRVMASPDRAWAESVKLLTHLGWLSDGDEVVADKAGDFAVLPLPICSIERGDPEPDAELGGVPKRFRKPYFNTETGKWEQHRWPGHYRTTYTLTFWMHKRYTEAYIREWIYGQLGALGSGEHEMMLPVTHRAPWGVRYQAFAFTGSSDLSTLEGLDDARYIRMQFTFSLRTWILRAEVLSVDLIEQISTRAAMPAVGYGVTNDDCVYLDEARSGQVSDNLFFLPNMFDLQRYWPVQGSARVELSRVRPARATLSPSQRIAFKNTMTGALDDAVEITERPILLGDYGYGIVSMRADALSQQLWGITVSQYTPGEEPTQAMQVNGTTGKSWTRFHRFALVNKPVFTIHAEGVAGSFFLHGMDVRTVVAAPMLGPGIADGGDHWLYTWTGLTSKTYLLVIAVSGGTGTVEAFEDVGDAVSVDSYAVSEGEVGAVLPMQPRASTLRLKVPKTLSVVTGWLQGYHGAYTGHNR